MPGDVGNGFCSLIVTNPSEGYIAVWNSMAVYEEESIRFEQTAETFVIGSEHHYVNVVVPGNEALVPDSPQ